MKDYMQITQSAMSAFLDHMYNELSAIEKELINDPVFKNAFEKQQSSIYGKDRDNEFFIKPTYAYRSKNEDDTTDETMLFVQQAKNHHKKNKGDNTSTVLKQCQNYHRDRYHALIKRNEAVLSKIEEMGGGMFQKVTKLNIMLSRIIMVTFETHLMI
ncbi:MAG: hypothetical protein GY821_14170 [Gammaproteobacteria bacterium]|nr:hypothetical protein [Gammaproteobacteria bacterium]